MIVVDATALPTSTSRSREAAGDARKEVRKSAEQLGCVGGRDSTSGDPARVARPGRERVLAVAGVTLGVSALTAGRDDDSSP